MKLAKYLQIALVTLLLVGSAVAQEVAPGISESDFKAMDAQVERTLAAYNKGDWKSFYADFAKMMAGIATAQSFDTLYVKNYKKNLGNYKSRKFTKEGSTGSTVNALLMYDGVFDKGKARIAINFIKEGDAFKIQQVQFNK